MLDKGIINYLKVAAGVVAIILAVTTFIIGFDVKDSLHQIEEQRHKAEDYARGAQEAADHLKKLSEEAAVQVGQARQLTTEARKNYDELGGMLRDIIRTLQYQTQESRLSPSSAGLSSSEVRGIAGSLLIDVLPKARDLQDSSEVKKVVDQLVVAPRPEDDQTRNEIGEQVAFAVGELNRLFGLKREVPKIVLLEEAAHDAFLDEQNNIYSTAPMARTIPDTAYHNLAHAYIEQVAHLKHMGQPGALFESYADVLATILKQKQGGLDAETADWTIAPGAGAWASGDDPASSVDKTPLRSLKDPGSAYRNHPALGDDPQVGRLRDLYQGSFDNGGVHINAGIPCRAFYQAARQIGTESAGVIWIAALRKLLPEDGFREACRRTIQAAEEIHGKDSREREAILRAWLEVGIENAP